MNQILSPEVVDRSVKGIVIPPRPQILLDLGKEMNRDDPSPKVVATLIGADVGLAAAVLKTVNSPFFGLSQRIASVFQAVNLLGLRSTFQIVTGIMARNAVKGHRQPLERFWDSAEKVANISAHVAGLLPRVGRDEAYSFGLFHDIGIPLLLQKFPDYRETQALAASLPDRSILDIEDERHDTNHATLGYLMAKSWFLPASLSEAILRHHDATVFDPGDTVSPLARALIGITCLAEHFNDELVRLRSNSQWDRIGGQVMDYFGFSNAEYLDMKEEISGMSFR